MKKRKSPTRHRVRPHTRKNKPVREHVRGRGQTQPLHITKKIVPNTYKDTGLPMTFRGKELVFVDEDAEYDSNFFSYLRRDSQDYDVDLSIKINQKTNKAGIYASKADLNQAKTTISHSLLVTPRREYGFGAAVGGYFVKSKN